MMVITPKHVGAVLKSILINLKLFLRQFNCASVGKKEALIVSRCTVGT
jgi:hypothetical protein